MVSYCGSSWLPARCVNRRAFLIQRFLLSCSPGMSLISIGVHSPKVTFSWARQIGVSEEARMSQGHHRASEARQNVALCGRDDVHAALDLQRQLVHRITRGFRSVIPLLRGGAKLLVDKPVNIRHTALDPCHMDHLPAWCGWSCWHWFRHFECGRWYYWGCPGVDSAGCQLLSVHGT